MIEIYLKLIGRNLWKNKVFTVINLLGIVIGFALSALLLLYVKKEMAANTFFPDSRQIYRVENNGVRNFSKKEIDLLQNQISEIDAITRYHGSWSQQDLIHYNNQDFEVEQACYADSLFFTVFPFEPLYGDLQNALNMPDKMVLTESEALRIFGREDPVGRSVKLKTSRYGIFNFQVAAVIKDLPNNCSFNFDAVFSLSTLYAVSGYNSDIQYWGTRPYSVFARLPAKNNAQIVSGKIKKVFKAHAPGNIAKNANIQFNPLKGLHFRIKYSDGVFNPTNKTTVSILGAIGVLILLVACFNYFNLTLAQLDDRIRTIGIKKVVGAKRWNLIVQSCMETFVLFGLALIFSTIIFYFVLPAFNTFTDSGFTLGHIFSAGNLLFISLFFVLSLTIFAFFPALLMGRQRAMGALQAGKNGSGRSYGLRNSMVVFQFVLALGLIVATLALHKQYRYMLSKDYGFSAGNVIYIPLSPESYEQMDYLEQAYEQLAITDEVAFGSSIFGSVANRWGRWLITNGEKQNVEFDVCFVGPDFFQLFDLKLVRGSGFTKSSSQQQDIIFNQTFVERYNLQNPLSGKLNQGEGRGNVIGVVKDFHYNSLRDAIQPMGFVCRRSWTGIMFVKFHPGSFADMRAAIDTFEKQWQKVSPNFPFEYHFMEDHTEHLYRSEVKLMKIFTISSILAILIALLGLIGIAYYDAGKRLKEIGIRKVNGAEVKHIVLLLNKGLLVKVLLAIAIACPVTYYLLQKWLQHYAYRTELSIGVFVTGALLILIIALLSISLISYKAARSNPVDVLKYE